MDDPKQPRKSRTVVIIAAIIGSSIGALVGSNAMRSLSDSNLDQGLVQASKQINQALPMRLDDATRLEITLALPGKKLMYKYTLTNLTEKPDPKALVDAMRPIVTNTYKTSTEMANLRKQGVTLVYAYYDETGSEVAHFEVTPNDIK